MRVYIILRNVILKFYVYFYGYVLICGVYKSLESFLNGNNFKENVNYME